MQRATITKWNAGPYALLDRVEVGETIEITDTRNSVARLEPATSVRIGRCAA